MRVLKTVRSTLFYYKARLHFCYLFAVPRMLTQALAIIDKDLPKILVFIMDRVNVLTTAVDNCFKINKNDSGYYITHELPEGVSEGALEFYKDVLVVYRQYEVYIR